MPMIDKWPKYVWGNAPYRLVYADPAWLTPNGRRQIDGRRYPKLRTSDVLSLPVEQLLQDNAVLLLWVTWPHLADGVEVIEAWGFKYISGMPWVKTTKDGSRLHPGMGVWVRECSELLLIGKRGKVDPGMRKAPYGVHLEPRQANSRKPEAVPELWLERIGGPAIELFARRKRPGWSVWGNEV